MKTLQELQPLIIDWANERNLVKLSNAPKQRLKLIEEAGELANAILKNNVEEQKDALGDIFVVLIILSAQVECEAYFPDDAPIKIDKDKDQYDLLSNICAFVKYPDSELLMLDSLAVMLGHDLTECANLAYNTIKNRTGKTVNGTFTKDAAN